MALTPFLTTTARPGTASRAIGSLRLVAGAASRIHTWANGLEARRRTQGALRPLERRGWQVSHDIPLREGGRVDHLVVGPHGVYVLASCAWSGVVTVDQKGATVTPPHDPAAAWTARGQHRTLPPAAVAVVRALSVATGGAVSAPRAVVVVWAPFPDRIADSGGITYVAGDHLADWLSGQPRRLEGSRLIALAAGAGTMRLPHQRRYGATTGARLAGAHATTV